MYYDKVVLDKFFQEVKGREVHAETEGRVLVEAIKIKICSFSIHYPPICLLISPSTYLSNHSSIHQIFIQSLFMVGNIEILPWSARFVCFAVVSLSIFGFGFCSLGELLILAEGRRK